MSDPTNAELKELIDFLIAKSRVDEARFRVLAATVEEAMKKIGLVLPDNLTLLETMAPLIREDVKQTLMEYEDKDPAMAARMWNLIQEMYPDKM